MEIVVNGKICELPEGYKRYEGGYYEYCLECEMPFKSLRDKYLCSIHWRPKSGTKEGWPLENGTNCPRDGWEIEWSDDVTESNHK